MARGNVLTDRVRSLIAEIYLNHPDWRSSKIREELIKRLHRENPYYDDPEWPRLNTVQKELTKIRRSHHKVAENNEEEVWSLFSYSNFEVPPDALPVVLRVWLSAREDDKMPVTNREVKWIVRLHKVIKDVKMLNNRAKSLASSELLGEILGLAIMAHPSRPLTLIEDMTGQEFSKEEARRITQAHLPKNYHKEKARAAIKRSEQLMVQVKEKLEANQ